MRSFAVFGAALGMVLAAQPGLANAQVALEQALAAARQANLPDAHGSLNEFRDVWTTTRNDVRRRSPGVADMVQAAYDQAAAVISDPRRATPQPSEYVPVLQTLLDVVQRANQQIAP